MIVLGEDCPRPKPYPDPYQRALDALGLQPHEAIVVEDSPAGAGRGSVAAHACGGRRARPLKCTDPRLSKRGIAAQ